MKRYYVLADTELISQTRSGATSYYLQDGQGSTRALTNSAGAVTDTYSYTAYGEIYNQTGTTANNYLYTGQQFDPSTGLYSLRARFYNPSWGRFLSQDTWAVNYSHPIELNRYGYAAGNPVNASDPSGNQASVEYAILLGGIGGATFGAVSDIACGGNGFAGAASGFVMGIGFTAIALTNPQAALAIGAFGAGMNIVSGSLAYGDMLLNGANACNSTQLTFAIVGLFWSSGFQSGPPSRQLAMNNGLTTSAQALSQLVVVGNVVTTVGEVTGVLSLLMSSEGGDGRNPQKNREQGEEGKKRVAEILKQQGFNILGEEVNVKIFVRKLNATRTRRVDILTLDFEGNIIAVEVKTGNEPLDPRQVMLDEIMATEGGIISSKNVPPRYNNEWFIIKTIYFSLP